MRGTDKFVEKVFQRHNHVLQKAQTLFDKKKTIGFKNMPRNVHTSAEELNSEDYEKKLTPTLSERDLYSKGDYGCEFLLQIAQRNPSYKFYTTLSRGRGAYYIDTIFVFDVDEPVGSMEYYSAGAYSFHNNRISNDLLRGNAKKTTKLAAAKKIFTSYFYGLTLKERMQKVQHTVHENLYENKWSTDNQHNSIMSDLQRFVEKEFTAQDSALLQYLETAGQKELLARYVSTKENREIAKRLKKSMKEGKGLYVLVQGDTYCTWDAETEDTPRRIKRVDLSSEMRTALGLLKVADKGTVVDGAGYKVNDRSFFIMKEMNLEFDE